MKKQMKVALFAIMFAGLSSVAQADESGLNGGIGGYADVKWGSGGVVGQVQGVSGTNGFFGQTQNNLAGSVNLDMSAWRGSGIVTVGGGSQAQIGHIGAAVSSSSYSSGSVSVQGGMGAVTTSSSVGSSAMFRGGWH